MSKSKILSFRVGEPWLNRLGQLLNVVASKKDRDRSRIVRQLIEKDIFLWLNSPYVSLESTHFVMVTAQGDVFYHELRDLLMNDLRHKMPFSLSMKPEKRIAYEKLYRDSGPEKIRKHWLLNYFATWDERTRDTNPISSHVDREGIAVKSADLAIERHQDSVVTREVVVALRDYVQHQELRLGVVPAPILEAEDHWSVPIGVPSLNIDLQILVDLDLYQLPERDLKAVNVDYELRNLEGARFASTSSGSSDNPIVWTRDRAPEEIARYIGTEYGPALGTVKASFEGLQRRVRHLAKESTQDDKGTPVVESQEARSRLLNLKLPKRFLFGHLTWARPFQGLTVCLAWNKCPPRTLS